MATALSLHHLDDEAARIARLRDGLLIVPPAGSRFIDHPRDLRWVGALACIASTAFVGSLVVLTARFVAVL